MNDMQVKQSAVMEAIKNAFEKQVEESYSKYDKQDQQYVNLQNQVLKMDSVLKIADQNVIDCMEQIQLLRGGKSLKINGHPVLSTLQEHRSDIEDLYEFTETVKVKAMEAFKKVKEQLKIKSDLDTLHAKLQTQLMFKVEKSETMYDELKFQVTKVVDDLSWIAIAQTE